MARLVHAWFAESALHFFDATRAQDEVFAEAMALGIAYTIGIVLVSLVVLFFVLKACGYNATSAYRSVLSIGDSGHGDVELGSPQRMPVGNPMAGED